MMILLLRGASTAKQTQGLSRAEPNSQERARAPPDAGVHSREAGVHSQGPPKAGVHWRDYVVLRLARMITLVDGDGEVHIDAHLFQTVVRRLGAPETTYHGLEQMCIYADLPMSIRKRYHAGTQQRHRRRRTTVPDLM